MAVKISCTFVVIKFRKYFLARLEPVGSVLPKFPTGETSKAFTSESSGTLTLMCPAQAFPVPFFR